MVLSLDPSRDSLILEFARELDRSFGLPCLLFHWGSLHASLLTCSIMRNINLNKAKLRDSPQMV